MDKVSQFIYGREVTVSLDDVKKGELYFTDHEDKIAVYKKGKKEVEVIVNNYGELYLVKGINIKPPIRSFIILNA